MILKFKIIVVGDASVGKTSLIRHFCEGYFKEQYHATIGVTFLKKTLTVTDESGSHETTLQIWDVAGQELFAQIRHNYYRGAHGAMILYDVTNPQSLGHVPNWLMDIRKVRPTVPVIMIGNKIDLDYGKDKIHQQATTLSEKLGVDPYFASAKLGTNMNEVFVALIRKMITFISP